MLVGVCSLVGIGDSPQDAVKTTRAIKNALQSARIGAVVTGFRIFDQLPFPRLAVLSGAGVAPAQAVGLGYGAWFVRAVWPFHPQRVF